MTPEDRATLEALIRRVESLEDHVRRLDARTIGNMVIGPGRIESVPRRTIEEIQAQADELTALYYHHHPEERP